MVPPATMRAVSSRRLARALALVSSLALLTAGARAPSPTAGPHLNEFGVDPAAGISNIDHVIFVVQENRSYDHYFGTFPIGDGLPRRADGSFSVCIPDPEATGCRRPFHDTNQIDIGGPHGAIASRIDVHGGAMDGFVKAFRQRGTPCTHDPTPPWNCRQAAPGPNGTPDVLGFHTFKEIPNYWKYAKRFVLQDRMFAPVDSWTLPAHLLWGGVAFGAVTDIDDDTLAAVMRLSMRELAQRVLFLDVQTQDVLTRMRRIATTTAPDLIAKVGVGPDTAATLLITAGDNPDRIRHEKSFASLVGVSPIPVNSGQVQNRYRLNRGGDRQANAALWRIAIVRLATDPATREYVERRQSEGKTKSEAIRCLKRYIAREVFNALPRTALI